MEYWTAFTEYSSANSVFAKEFRKRKPTTGHWLSFGTGSKSCNLSVLRLMIENHIAVELYIYDDKDLYRSLFEHKEEIESDVGASLDWRELPEKKPAEFLSKKGRP